MHRKRELLHVKNLGNQNKIRNVTKKTQHVDSTHLGTTMMDTEQFVGETTQTT